MKEAAHYLRREVIRARRPDIVGQYRSYQARLQGRDYVDLRGLRQRLAEIYRPDAYTAGQACGAQVRASRLSGIAYDSVRDPGGGNVACFRPPAVCDVVQGRHVELTVRASGRIVVRQM